MNLSYVASNFQHMSHNRVQLCTIITPSSHDFNINKPEMYIERLQCLLKKTAVQDRRPHCLVIKKYLNFEHSV